MIFLFPLFIRKNLQNLNYLNSNDNLEKLSRSVNSYGRFKLN